MDLAERIEGMTFTIDHLKRCERGMLRRYGTHPSETHWCSEVRRMRAKRMTVDFEREYTMGCMAIQEICLASSDHGIGHQDDVLRMILQYSVS
jgi:hypothetical protein